MICATEKDKGPCHGDAAVGLVNEADGLIGVASWGRYCGVESSPFVFANLADKEIRDFVKQITGV